MMPIWICLIIQYPPNSLFLIHRLYLIFSLVSGLSKHSCKVLKWQCNIDKCLMIVYITRTNINSTTSM